MTVLPGQTGMFEEPPAPAVRQPPLEVSITARMHRTQRQKCAVCGMRRICYYIGLGGIAASPAVCAKDAGIR